MPRLTILIRGVTERLLQKRKDLVTGTGTMKNVFQYLKDLHLSFAKTMTLIFFGIKQNMNHQMGFMGISVQYNRGLLFIVAQTEEDLPLKTVSHSRWSVQKQWGRNRGQSYVSAAQTMAVTQLGDHSHILFTSFSSFIWGP